MMNADSYTFDLIVVGAGVLGTFHAYHAQGRGLKVALVERNGAPDRATALPVAKEELRQMVELCDEHLRGTVLTVARALTEAGVRGSFRMIEPRAAGLEQFAIHSSLNDEPLE